MALRVREERAVAVVVAQEVGGLHDDVLRLDLDGLVAALRVLLFAARRRPARELSLRRGQAVLQAAEVLRR